jgi:NitT/TauT family transport system ATP-binding protein
VKIQIQGVGKKFRVRDADRLFTALDDITLDVRSGEFLTLVGPSGCGKSTLLDLLAGLDSPTTGRILLNGTPVNGPGLDRGIVFQQYALFPWRTALSNIEFGLEAKAVSKKERAERARTYLELVGLRGFENRYPHELSGGMRQRVAIARSLAFDPDVLLMDEPFAALDALTRRTCQDELLQLWAETKFTVLFVTHSIAEAIKIGNRILLLSPHPGRVKAEVIDVDRVSSEDGSAARLEKQIHDLLFADAVTAH